MITTIILKKTPELTDPIWEKVTVELPALKGGDKVKLKVTGKNTTGDNTVRFEVRHTADERVLGVIEGTQAGAAYTAEWVVPMTPEVVGEGAVYVFHAVLREKPTAVNGHLGVLQRIISPELKVLGTKLTITKIDEAFIPKREKFEVEYKLEGAAPAKGRFEIWGERYPTNKPIYAEDFVPAAGDKEWKTWRGGKDNDPSATKPGTITLDGPLKDKYLTPEFSPYRFRIVVGPDQASIEAPWTTGANKVALIEKPFVVEVESLHIRLQDGPLTVKNSDCAVKITKSPQFYMPGAKLEVEYEITGTAPAKGRYEIWGTGYAGTKPLFKEDFVPATGAKKWDTWLGKGNEGALNNAELTPDYAPYRIRVIVGEDDEKIESPFDKGVGKVCLAEALFELHERIDDKYKYRLGYALAVEPRENDGSFAAMGRLPKDTEKARLRIMMARHQNDTEQLGQNGLNVAGGYIGGGTLSKYALDKTFYTRPQMPLEFVPHLRSREKAINDDADRKGIFEPEAVGPLMMDPFAEDDYQETLYDTTADADRRTYWRNAAHKVKRGAHNDPKNTANKPVFTYWQWRKKMDADVTVDTEYNVATFDDTMKYKVGANELTVWLNRTLLVLKTDYEEVGTGMVTKIKLKKNLARKDDVLWVVHSSSASTSVPKWKNFPPGNNCHAQYGGLRGDAANNLFLQDYAAHGGGTKEPILFKGTAPYPHKDQKFINLSPDPVPAAKQERVEVTALTTGTKKGLGGIIFSPSYLAGDSYILKVRVEDTPYAHNMGFESPAGTTKRPVKDSTVKEAKTGPLTVWAWLRIGTSLRLPDPNTCGMSTDPDDGNAAVGTPVADDPLGTGGGARAYRGDGYNMKLSDMNTSYDGSYQEWTMAPPVEISAAKGTAAVMVTKATKAKPIEITTGADHGLATGDCIKIKGATGNDKANGNWVVTVTGGRTFTLEDSDGTAAADNYKGGGRAVKPIEVKTKTPHGLETDDVIRITDVEGLTGTNGSFLVKVVDTKTILLNFSDGTKMDGSVDGTYTKGGLIDPHKGANLRKYRTAHNAVTTWGDGKVDLDKNSKIRNRFVQWDHYRVKLPPDFRPARVKVASKTINDTNTVPKGMLSDKAKIKVQDAVAAYDLVMPGGATKPDDAGYTGTVIPVHTPADPDDYESWVENLVDAAVGELLDALIPKEAQPRCVNSVRWPQWYDTHWTDGDTYDSTTTVTSGIYLGAGQSFFVTKDPDQQTFEHEMGHACHLSHFVAGNFEWKHHNLVEPNCMMSYTFTSGVIIKPAGGKGVDGNSIADGGWPDVVPNPLPDGCQISGSGNYGDPSIFYAPGLVPAKPCAKCIMRLRGWNDEFLPAAWSHPDSF